MPEPKVVILRVPGKWAIFYYFNNYLQFYRIYTNRKFKVTAAATLLQFHGTFYFSLPDYSNL